MEPKQKKIGEILIAKKLLSSKELENTLAKQPQCHKKLGELLVEEGLITENDLSLALKEQKWREDGFWVID